MSAEKKSLWALCDGKPGHENQIFGLADAMASRGGLEVETIHLPHGLGIGKRWRRLRTAVRDLPAPAFVAAAGHSTHWFLLYAARRTRARSILLMKPSLPEWLFDLCVIPAHDLPGGVRDTERCFVTRGAVNRMRFDPSAKDGRGVILIGGPSREHGWESERLLACLREIVTAEPRRQWVLTSSRRTPENFLPSIRELLPDVESWNAADTPPDWLPEQLARAEVAWVTRDSVSMVYEALTAGARVGLLDVPLQRKAGKLTRGLEGLVRDGFATEWGEWRKRRELWTPPGILSEADRCARYVLERFA